MVIKSEKLGRKASRRQWVPTRKKAFQVVLWYIVVAVIWLAGSDWLAEYFVNSQAIGEVVDLGGDILIVVVTAAMLVWLQERYFREIQRAWERLRVDETRLRLVGDHLPDSYVYQYTRDADGKPRLLHISAGVKLVHGLEVDEVLEDAGCIFQQMDPEQVPAYTAVEAESARRMEDFEMELRFRRPDGETRLIHARSRPRLQDNGQILWDGFATDITRRRRLELDLEAGLARYRSLFDNMLNGFSHCEMIFDNDKPVDFLHVDVNPAFKRLTGLDNVIGKLASEVIPGIRRTDAKLLEVYGRVAMTGAPEKIEIYVEGLKNWFAISVYCPAKGHFVAVFDVATERKRAEVALRESEELFRAMFELASVGMGQANPDTGRFMRVNKKMCDITGYAANELLELRVPDITHPDDRKFDGELFQQVVRGEMASYQNEKRYVRKDGTIVWVNVNMSVIRDAAGGPVRTIATIEDITSRRKAEEERMRLITALEQSAESVVITDLRGMIVYVNPSFERVSGYARNEAIGRNPRFLQSGKQDSAFYRELWRTIGRGLVWRGRFTNKRKDGSLFEEEATISPVRDASGRIVNYMAIKLDVTRERELEGQFRQAQKLEAIGQLAGGVAHDFNNVLTSILMQAELGCTEEGVPSGCRENFQQIQKDAERAASLTRQLLLFSRRQVMQPRNLNLNEAVTSLAKMLQRIIGEDVRLQLNLHPVSLMTHADAGMLDQVVLNLAVNARDAMPGGGTLVIETSESVLDEEAALHQADAAPGRYVCLSVTDTGCGIPPELMPRIFEPFFTTKAVGKGTGLGLATVFGIVKQHHGWVTAESEVGRGTTFRMCLPAIAANALKFEDEIFNRPRGGSETILLAEDEAMVRSSIKIVLVRNGYTVLEAANGEEALSVWRNSFGRVALLLADLVMPGGVTGQQLARQLKAGQPGLKVVYTSGYNAEIAGREIQLQKGESFVQKPLNPEALLKAVRSCLDN